MRQGAGYLTLGCLAAPWVEDALAEELMPFSVLGAEIVEFSAHLIRIKIYLASDQTAVARELEGVLAGLGCHDIELSTLAEEDWLLAYRTHVKPFAVGRRWWLDPHPGDPTPAPDRRWRLAIEPRMAFGTGSHESTQLVLLELEELEPAALKGRRVLDVGTGSGILALAAELLGAHQVVGLDVDPQAVWVARQIVRDQEWPAAPRLVVGPLACLGEVTFDLVLCNMIPENFLPLLDDLARVLGATGQLMLSGLLSGQGEAVGAELRRVGLQVVGERISNEWLGLRAVPGAA